MIQNNLALFTQPLTHSGVGRQAVLTFASNVAGGLTAQQAVDAFFVAFKARFTARFDTNVTLEKPSVNLGVGSTTPFQAVAAGATAVGTNSIVSLSPQICMLARKRSAVGGRKNRGRTYFPWTMATADVTEGGNIIAATVTAQQAALTGFLADLAAANIAMVIANKVLSPGINPGSFYVSAIDTGPTVTSYICESIIATQRRRLPR